MSHLLQAAEENNLEKVKQALATPGTDINYMKHHRTGDQSSEEGMFADHPFTSLTEWDDGPALRCAVERNNLEMVKYLLEKGADPHKKWQTGAYMVTYKTVYELECSTEIRTELENYRYGAPMKTPAGVEPTGTKV